MSSIQTISIKQQVVGRYDLIISEILGFDVCGLEFATGGSF